MIMFALWCEIYELSKLNLATASELFSVV